eukprot:1159792-Amphidinium_carterae.1
MATINDQLQKIIQGQDMLLQGHRAVESTLSDLGNKVAAHDTRLAAVEKQLAQVKQDRSRSLPHAVAFSADSTQGKRPRSSPHSPAEAQPAADDRYQRTLVVNGWIENFARSELVAHGQRLLKQAKDAMVVVRHDGTVKLWVSKDKPAIYKRRDYILRSLKRN